MGKFVKQRPEEHNTPIWSLTYADLMNLVLAFFVALVSYSTVNAQKYREAVQSFRGAFHAFTRAGSAAGSSLQGVPHPSDELDRAARDLQQRFQVMGRGQDIRTDYDIDGGLRITLPAHLLFAPCQAELLPETHDLLKSMAEVLEQLPNNPIEVAGHTDNRPLPSKTLFRDNLDLSYTRADVMARRLADYGKISLARFTIGGCGEGQPIATNETESGRQANFRIEICVRANKESSKIPLVRKDLERKLKPADGAVVPINQ